MPETVGVRDLKNDASKIIRMVREEKAEYNEQVVAATQPDEDFWARLDALGKEIDAQWTSSKTGVELVSEQWR